ncbi:MULTISPECIES: LysR family transcriptional regulator [unclassified Rhodococcus (in: high G+C Gram-positive bacteria)]|uniref:LysR family transcriptional regulator n=1 Tax=unclassified Rhodococcus (in: high G+C Gram-positive bacteria) TaxID=192944 RepID=UPI00146EDC7A|nr:MULTISPECIES: LysR family transcriptional regulator [unclassified Rhodococcus (in: high G+C Gram-positive bacteria)]MBF0660395.1 LysR family transcriptional regulator [Rhodococcus sp. (in: high G+C Gram-positive bacteria)]NME77532.1 LysR family transcriptional regulator [Rhodococcus sp. 105337]
MTDWPDLAALDLLVGIDDHGGLGAAARKAGIAQPNATRMLRRLEKQLGAVLVRRGRTGSVLTPEGTVVAHWAREVLADTARMLDAAASLRVDHPPELVVAASMTVAEHLIPRWLGEFRAIRSDVQIQLHVHNSVQVCDAAAAGECDVGFVEGPSVPRGLYSVPVARDRLVVVVPPDHPWARRRRPLTVAELASTPLVVREVGSGTRRTLDLALEEYARPAPLLELGSSAAVRTSVLGGAGPAVLSTLAVAEDLESGKLRAVDVEGLDLSRVLRAVWRPPRALAGPAGELVRMITRPR